MGKYIDKIEFHNILRDYRNLTIQVEEFHFQPIGKNPEKDLQELIQQKDLVFNKIGRIFLKIAINFMNKPRYINYTDDWKDDMVSEAVYDMIRYIHNYDIELMEKYLKSGKIPDPFAYFTQYVRNGATRYLSERYKDGDIMVRIPFIENMDKRDITYE